MGRSTGKIQQEENLQNSFKKLSSSYMMGVGGKGVKKGENHWVTAALEYSCLPQCPHHLQGFQDIS